MTVDELSSLNSPAQLGSDHLKALWYDLHGDWNRAHRIVQSMYDADSEWIHAYLHRKEPDIANARYWYQRCGRPFPGEIGFDDEAATILSELG